MTLFALAGIPCFTLVIGALAEAWAPGRRSAATMRVRAVRFLKGAALAVPALVVVLLLRRYIPVSYRFFLLYLHGAAIDHLLPAAILAAACLVWFRRADFQELLFFCGGFYSVIGLGTTIAAYGRYDPHLLFLLPALRMGTMLVLPLLLLRFAEWYGAVRVLYGATLAALPLGAGGVSYVFARQHGLAAILLTVGFLSGAVCLTWLDRR